MIDLIPTNQVGYTTRPISPHDTTQGSEGIDKVRKGKASRTQSKPRGGDALDAAMYRPETPKNGVYYSLLSKYQLLGMSENPKWAKSS